MLIKNLLFLFFPLALISLAKLENDAKDRKKYNEILNRTKDI